MRLLPLTVAPVLAVSLLAGPAGAVPDAPAPEAPAAVKVTNNDFPTLKQVVKVWPKLKGGVRSIETAPGVEIIKTCKDSTLAKARSARMASYVSLRAEAVVMSTVAQMKSVKQAKKAVKSYRKLIACSPISEGGDTITIKKLATPKLGDDRAGLAIVFEGEAGAMEWLTFRRKARVITVQVYYMGGKRTPAKTKKFARIAYRKGL